MGRPGPARAALLAHSTALLALAGGPVAHAALHPLDIRSVVCDSTTLQIDGITAGNGSEGVHVLSFFRTSPLEVALRFSLQDLNGATIYEEGAGVQLLQQVLGVQRRLGGGASGDAGRRRSAREAPEAQAQDAGEDEGCEELFLSDGRTPVELPDTWAEAREAYRELCRAEGVPAEACVEVEGKAFQGLPADPSPLAANAMLCERLLQGIAALQLVDIGNSRVPLSQLRTAGGKLYRLGRRLKGVGGSPVSASSFGFSGGTSSRTVAFTASGAAVGGAMFSSGRVSNSFGYSQDGLTSSYASGPRQTAYGYSGGSRQHQAGSAFSVVRPPARSYYGVRMGYVGQWHRAAGGDGEPASEGCGALEVCESALARALYRDDLMVTGFVPAEYAYPLKLLVSHVSGPAYTNRPSFCPPVQDYPWGTWIGSLENASALSRSATPWLFRDVEDIYVDLTPMEDIFTEVVEEDKIGRILLEVLISVCFWCFVLFFSSVVCLHFVAKIRRCVKGKRKDPVHYPGGEIVQVPSIDAMLAAQAARRPPPKSVPLGRRREPGSPAQEAWSK